MSGFYRGPGGTGDAITDASSQATIVVIKANEAAASSTSASASASAASTSATAASNSASDAASSATEAGVQATNADNSATASANSATDASNSATAASASASTASTQATNAGNSASAAAASETNAASSASDASASASAAATSETNAASSATAAAASYDSFDDRYLGPKTANPTTDNDGNALISGALYFNSVVPEMRVWNGTNWTPLSAGGGSIVTTFNTRSGDVTLSSSDVTTALTYTPQTQNARLTDVAAITPTDNVFIVGNGTNLVGESGATARTSMGLGSIATQASNSVTITGGSITGITDLAIADGGTGASTAQTAINALAGAVTAAQYLRGNGTNVVMSAIQASDVPTLNQNTTGTAAGLSATLAASSGGTGQASYAVGDLLYASTTTALSKLADVASGNSLISGGVGVAPSWGKIGLTTHVSGTLAVTNGGTGVTTSTGSGNNVLSTSPTLVTPVLGTPSSGTLTSCTGLPLTTGVTGTLPVANGGTGAVTLTGYVKGTGTTAMTASATIPGSDINGTIDGGTY
jgi:hypothetical protein